MLSCIFFITQTQHSELFVNESLWKQKCSSKSGFRKNPQGFGRTKHRSSFWQSEHPCQHQGGKPETTLTALPISCPSLVATPRDSVAQSLGWEHARTCGSTRGRTPRSKGLCIPGAAYPQTGIYSLLLERLQPFPGSCQVLKGLMGAICRFLVEAGAALEVAN